MKGTSHWVSATFYELKNTQKTDNFGFSFTTKNLNDFLSFKFYLLCSKSKEIEFINNKKHQHIKF